MATSTFSTLSSLIHTATISQVQLSDSLISISPSPISHNPLISLTHLTQPIWPYPSPISHRYPASQPPSHGLTQLPPSQPHSATLSWPRSTSFSIFFFFFLFFFFFFLGSNRLNHLSFVFVFMISMFVFVFVILKGKIINRKFVFVISVFMFVFVFRFVFLFVFVILGWKIINLKFVCL